MGSAGGWLCASRSALLLWSSASGVVAWRGVVVRGPARVRRRPATCVGPCHVTAKL
ncbi:uncharacterized protein SCHCODRAFT_02620025, partial [Schizophyllum commune H4-8]|uniref:uncharacterized protein n=1 Tax=Schizophyllum commune (strain H4-8 / FGSC 9210) TaxID=578458 RepID=UPI00215F5A05